jgi:hypothetical protein
MRGGGGASRLLGLVAVVALAFAGSTAVSAPAHAGGIVTITQNDQADAFIQAVGSPGSTVRIAPDVDLDLSGRADITIASGVQIIGQTDAGHPDGPRVFTTTFPARLLDVGSGSSPSDNVRISEIRLDGGQGDGIADGDAPTANGITAWSANNLEIDHNEVYGWRGAGISIRDDLGRISLQSNPDTVHIHDNWIHHNQHYSENGYGIEVVYGAYALIDKNAFDYNRHDVASDGRDGSGYLLYRNLLLYHGGVNDVTLGVTTHTHFIDMHGRDSCNGFSYYCGPAGEYIDIEYNTILYTEGTAFKLRGTPSIGATVKHNTFEWDKVWGGLTIVDDAAMVQTNDSDHKSIDQSDNHFGVNPYGTYNETFDFDGDGAPDRFMPTGVAWWILSSHTGRWTYLNTSTAPLNAITFSDVDGDGHTDASTGGVAFYHGRSAEQSIAYQANTTRLWTIDADGHPAETSSALAPNTSPAVAALSNGGYETAFVASNGVLWVTNPDGNGHSTGLQMWPGTSPAIAADGNGGWMIAAEDKDSRLWTIDSAGNMIKTPSAMSPTSPAITALSTGGYEIAFIASSGDLWVQDSAGGHDTGLVPAAGPAIAADTGGGWKIAIHGANTDHLWTLDSTGKATDTGAVMASGTTSPAIAPLRTGGYEMAFAAWDGYLWKVEPNGNGSLAGNGLGVAPDTSPAIAPSDFSGWRIAFHAGGDHLWTIDSGGHQADTGSAMATGTSPGIFAPYQR